MIKLNPKELEILDILWEPSQALTAKQIYLSKPDLVMSTVQSTVKKLLRKELIEIDGITYSGTVLTRTYKPTLSLEEFLMSQYKKLDVAKLVKLENKYPVLKDIERDVVTRLK